MLCLSVVFNTCLRNVISEGGIVRSSADSSFIVGGQHKSGKLSLYLIISSRKYSAAFFMHSLLFEKFISDIETLALMTTNGMLFEVEET